jgi:hypothetical protein
LITGLILAPVTDEFTFKAPLLSLAANAGLLVGAVFWGFGCDIWGRRYEDGCYPFLLAVKNDFWTFLLDGVSTSLCYLLAFLVLLLVVRLILLCWHRSSHWLA